jgi:hypothetical protein
MAEPMEVEAGLVSETSAEPAGVAETGGVETSPKEGEAEPEGVAERPNEGQ